MPATSKSQQRLMAQAYAIKTGKMKPEDLDPKYKAQIMDLANSMDEKDLKDYAETPHTGLPEVKEGDLPMFENFIESQTLNEGEIKRKVITVIQYTGSMWRYMGDEAGTSEKEYAEEIADDLELIKGSMFWSPKKFLINGFTKSGKSLYIEQDGEFDKYGGPYEPKMKSFIVRLGDKNISANVSSEYKRYGYDMEKGNNYNLTRTDIWGHILRTL